MRRYEHSGSDHRPSSVRQGTRMRDVNCELSRQLGDSPSGCEGARNGASTRRRRTRLFGIVAVLSAFTLAACSDGARLEADAGATHVVTAGANAVAPGAASNA